MLRGFDSAVESPTLSDQLSDANVGYSGVPDDAELERAAYYDETHQITDEDLDIMYEEHLRREREEVEAARKYPGFSRLSDAELQRIIDDPFCPAKDDDADLQRTEAAAELLRRKIGTDAA